jgi:hypothetical protein
MIYDKYLINLESFPKLEECEYCPWINRHYDNDHPLCLDADFRRLEFKFLKPDLMKVPELVEKNDKILILN